MEEKKEMTPDDISKKIWDNYKSNAKQYKKMASKMSICGTMALSASMILSVMKGTRLFSIPVGLFGISCFMMSWQAISSMENDLTRSALMDTIMSCAYTSNK